MTPEQRQQTTRLFVALAYGEQLAQRCATHQATLVANTKAQRFLRAQARQEGFHGFLFQQAANWLTPRHRIAVPDALLRFGRSLDNALQRDDLIECLVGSQIVLEGFGEQVLTRLNRGMDNLEIGFKRQRQLILQQEQSHGAFGLHTLESQLQQEQTQISLVHELAEKYVQLAYEVTTDMADVFVALDEDANEYIENMTNNLPCWLFKAAS